MKTLQEIKSIIEMHKNDLQRRYGVREIGIFGSFVRDEQQETSDIDMLIEFEKPISLLRIVNLENYLSDLIGIKVDLVSKEDVRPELREDIFGEAVYL